MHYRLSDIPELFRTPAGRLLLRDGVNFRIWPLSSTLARLYRRTLVRRTRVIAVVGSLGKSTTTRAVAAALGLSCEPAALRNSWSSVALAVLRIRLGQSRAVIEVGVAGPGQMEAYARVVRPDIAVVTSIGSEHNRSFRSLEATRAEKAHMVRALPESGIAVLNGDDPNVLWMRQFAPTRVCTFGFGEGCDVRAVDSRLRWPEGMWLRIRAFGTEREVATRLVGRSMAYALLASLAVAHLEGIDLGEATRRLTELPPTPGRMDPVPLANEIVILRDDFKSTLESIHSALDTFGEVPARRRIVVLGDVAEPPGPQRPIYKAIGERVARMATSFIIVGRGFAPYHSGARRGGMPNEAIIDGGRSPRSAAAALLRVLQPGDVVLIKGRDTQKLDRVRLILQGREVRCDIRACGLQALACERCPMLEHGWGMHRVVL